MTEKRRPNPLPELSEEDAELLSAYIDNMLSAHERAELESRLEEEAFLRGELSAMQQTVAWVNQLPPLKAPRNFTITASDVQNKQKVETPQKVLRPNFGWTIAGTAAAVVVILIGFSFVLLQSGGGAPAAEQEAIAQLSSSTAIPELGNEAKSSDGALVLRSALPTGTAIPTQSANTVGLGVTAAAPIPMEVTAVSAQDETASSLAQAPAVEEAANNNVQATNESALVAATQAIVAQAQSATLNTVGQTATALTNLFAATPTTEALSTGGSVARPGENVPATPETTALSGAGGASNDNYAVEDTVAAQEAPIAESTEEAPLSIVASSSLPNTGGTIDFTRLGNILLALFIKLITGLWS